MFVSPVLSTKSKKHAAATSTTDDDSSIITPGDIVPSLPVLSTPIGGPYFSDYSVHGLLDTSDQSSIDHPSTSSVSQDVSVASQANEPEIIVNTALLACIEYLQLANKHLQDDLDKQKPKYFRLEIIMHNDKLVQFYTGFQSYELLIAFYEFLGPSVSNLKYWVSKPVKTKQ